MNRSSHRPLALLLAVLATCLLAAPSSAQYFGRNKVLWDKFKFEVLETEHFQIHYYPESRAAAEDVARMAERWYSRLSGFFNHEFTKKPIVLYANHPDFQQTTTTGGFIGEGTGGFTDMFQNRIVMPLTGVYEETDHVLGHEMVHVFQYDMAARLSNQQRRFRLMSLPLWMIEGLAEYLSQGRIDPQTAMWLRDTTIEEKMPDAAELTRDPRFSPYQYGQAFWAYIGGRWGDAAVRDLFMSAGLVGIEQAFQETLGRPAAEVFADWQQSARDLYSPVVAPRQLPDAMGAPLVGALSDEDALSGAKLNIAPSYSPDGEYIAFLSARGLFSIDLYVADAGSGEIVERVAGADSDPHYDALRFIDSSGSWSPDSRRFAYVVTESGDNRIAIVDVREKEVTERIPLPGIGAITNPVWSPDGKTIAFSGQTGGITDLYLLDLATKELRQLTNDRFGDLQPAWSPDGKTIAFATERGPRTDMGSLQYGKLSIAEFDLESNTITRIPLFETARHINPQYSPDGKTIYFVSDPDGISNIYSYSKETGEMRRLTNVATGVAGITDLSPCISVSASSGRIAYSLFAERGWNIFSLDPDTVETSVVTMALEMEAPARVLPPSVQAQGQQVSSYLAQPEKGLPSDDTAFSTKEYSKKLKLNYVGPPTIGVGVDRYGLGVGGSVALGFSDVLGKHQLGFFLQGTGATSNASALFGAQMYYLNQENRYQWGGSLTHLPYVDRFSGYEQREIELDGQVRVADVYLDIEDIVTIDEVSVINQYPFSTTKRFELTVGYTNQSYDTEIEEFIVVDGLLVDNNRYKLDLYEDIGYYRAATAFVGDSSVFGFISPIKGSRYRFEIGTTGGDLDFETALADYRKYWFARPVTFALRGLFFGRFGDGAEDRRLSLLDVGRETLVRGYTDFKLSECTLTGPQLQSCRELDNILGSKLATFNFEVRYPLIGPKGYGLIDIPFFPTEVAAFFDGGAAWTEDETPDWSWADDTFNRVPIFSAGFSARIVIGGVLPVEFYYAWPFQRPAESGGVYGFLFTPGW